MKSKMFGLAFLLAGTVLAQDAEVTVDEGDGRLGGRGVEEPGVVEPDAGNRFGELRRGDATLVDGNLSSLTSAVVGHGNGLRHNSSIQYGGSSMVCQPAGNTVKSSVTVG